MATTDEPTPNSGTTGLNSPLVAFVVDSVCVMLFVLIGRSNHQEGFSLQATVTTAIPFLIGLGVGWVFPIVRRDPRSARSGAIVWASTVAVGMLARNLVFGDGTALSFIIVATVFLGVALNGWRMLYRAIASDA